MDVRKRVCLMLGDDGRLSRLVSDAGWRVRPVRKTSECRQVLQEGAASVGVVLFNHDWLGRGSASGEALLAATAAQVEWIGLVIPELVREPRIQELIANYCTDYHTLPIDERRLLNALGHAYGMARLRQRCQPPATHRSTARCMIGESPVMRRVFRQLAKIAHVNAPVLLVGESGTGKELAAQAIHQASSRSPNPFIAVNCGAIPSSLIQSELYGHEKGAFTGAYKRQIGRIEAANGGTLFLDEIGDLPLALQVNLLRFLQEKTIERVGGTAPIPVDVRVIAATHKDLSQEVSAGRFREDLYYRLCVLKLLLPPLRERPEDIVALAYHYFYRYVAESNPKVQGFTRGALERMRGYSWPGNVRELKNKVQRALVMCDQKLLGEQDLELEVAPPDLTPTLAEVRAEAERHAIRAALQHNNHNILKASRQLGISRVTFYRMLEKYQLAAR